jgi:hypothetical protein
MKITFKEVIFTLIFGALIVGFVCCQGRKELEHKLYQFEQQEKTAMDIDTAKMLAERVTPNQLKLNLFDFPMEEIKKIEAAAKRNNLKKELIPVLYSIRKTENGKKGREFGIIHPKCEILMAEDPEHTFEIQAGWAAATIQKNYDRWIEAGRPNDFISFLGEKYCPTKGGLSVKESELNKYWITNVKFWSKKINGDKNSKQWRKDEDV